MSPISPSRSARVRGCILGLAVGDAMGVPVIGLKGGRVRQLFGEIDGFVDGRAAWESRPGRWRLPGLHGSVTQQALTIARVAIDTGEVTPAFLLDAGTGLTLSVAQIDFAINTTGESVVESFDSVTINVDPGPFVRASAVGATSTGSLKAKVEKGRKVVES